VIDELRRTISRATSAAELLDALALAIAAIQSILPKLRPPARVEDAARVREQIRAAALAAQGELLTRDTRSSIAELAVQLTAVPSTSDQER
jgi:hypothetical protein